MSIIKSIGKFTLLTVLFLIFYIGSTLIFLPDLTSLGSPEPGLVPPPFDILIIGAANVFVLWLVVNNSRWSGWRLMLGVAFAYYGLTNVIMHIETAYFLSGITLFDGRTLLGLFLSGLPVAFIYVPLAITILGKGRQTGRPLQPNLQLIMPLKQWRWKTVVITSSYLLLYFGAGYFIAWQNPDLRAFYGGTDPGSFLLQMKAVLQNDPWLVPFQIMRSGLLVIFALPIIRMAKNKPWTSAVTLGLLYAVPVNIGHLTANPFMPSNSVRMSHMVETISSTFVFGLIVVWLLHRSHFSFGDLFGTSFLKPLESTKKSQQTA